MSVLYQLILLFYIIITIYYLDGFSFLKLLTMSINIFYDVLILILNWVIHSTEMLINAEWARVYITGSLFYILM